ncbi:MAG: hypothetical protein V4523_03160 [Pseudomonadota bacterium]|nr:hypothetical protein [Sphingobium sp. Z007]
MGHQVLTVRIGQSRPALFCVEWRVRITLYSIAHGLSFRWDAEKRDE